MIELSAQQEDIVFSKLVPLAVTACAGSGKTFTAVRRLSQIRAELDDRHGHVALLSFSNIAVETFRRDYLGLLRQSGATNPHGVEIDTVDGFITSNVLRPHGHLVMGCDRAPFLVDGREPFLRNFTVFDGQRPVPTNELGIGMAGGEFAFSTGRNKKVIPANAAKTALKALGKVGAYSHDAARYWVLRVLREHPFVLRALVRRYPHVLVDEAQDIGAEHEAILSLLAKNGTQLSLIGDANQGIYEFSGANGVFLGSYGKAEGVEAKELETNFRSVPAIVEIANTLSKRNDKASRSVPDTLNGAYVLTFKNGERAKALASFASLLVRAGVEPHHAAVLCRSASWADEWAGGNDAQGQGTVRMFAEAAIHRDKSGRLDHAFDSGCAAIAGLLSEGHRDLVSKLTRPSKDPVTMRLRRAIWAFLRDPATGLPSATLIADTEWHPNLVARAKTCIADLAANHGLVAGDNLGQKLAKKELANRPLIEIKDLAEADVPTFRVSTVHKVKGESIDGVMYVCSKDHAEELLGGTTTEVGRIGYVALTRARNLFVLAVPENSLVALEPRLAVLGFQKP